jgi:hypothetical protein
MMRITLREYFDSESNITHGSKQEILDEIRTPGYVGLRVEDVERWRAE